MQLSQFIEQNVETIVTEWEAFARATMEPAQTMSRLALRDHASQILLAIAKDLRQPQTENERHLKSQGLAKPDASETSAATHGVLRQLVGFDLVQLAAEYRAVRATVLRLWKQVPKVIDANVVEDVARFNEAVDQALAESIASYSERVAHSRDTFLAVLGHDLRSPLSAVTSALQLLGDSRSQDQQKNRALQIAKRSAASMRQMIIDLLEYTRTRLGQGIEIVAEVGDLAGLCRDVVEEVDGKFGSSICCAHSRAAHRTVRRGANATGTHQPLKQRSSIWSPSAADNAHSFGRRSRDHACGHESRQTDFVGCAPSHLRSVGSNTHGLRSR
jgi:signal transduction histidine kinase